MARRAVTTAGKAADEARIGVRNKQKILKAATSVFARKGFDGTRISDIAELSGLPKANVYYYFASKEAIYEAVIEHLIQGWDDALSHISPDREPIEAFTAYVRAKLEHTRKNPEESRLFATEVIRGAQFLGLDHRRHIKAVTDERVAVVEGWIEAGKMARVDPRHLFIILWSATQYYADFEPLAALTLDARKLGPSHYKAAAETIVATVLAGISNAPFMSARE